jgi:hypothetical protein
MAKVSFTGVVLEKISNPDRDGKMEKDGVTPKVYHSLIMYETGQKYIRRVTEIKLGNEFLEVASKCVGKVHTVITDMSEFNGKNSFYFVSVAG